MRQIVYADTGVFSLFRPGIAQQQIPRNHLLIPSIGIYPAHPIVRTHIITHNIVVIPAICHTANPVLSIFGKHAIATHRMMHPRAKIIPIPPISLPDIVRPHTAPQPRSGMKPMPATPMSLTMRHLGIATALNPKPIAGPSKHRTIQNPDTLTTHNMHRRIRKIPPITLVIVGTLNRQISYLNIRLTL